MAKPPRVVAELGRPETPEETAARKAENSRRHRANQTSRNLVLALAASLGIVLLLVLIIVRPDQPDPEPVDYASIAQDAEPAVGADLASPVLPPGWSSNNATLDTPAQGVTSWTVGFITPSSEYVAVKQGLDANPTWTANVLEEARATSELTIGSLDWIVYDHRDERDAGNLAYALSTLVGSTSYVLYGTAPDDEFVTLASALEVQLAEDQTSAISPSDTPSTISPSDTSPTTGATP